MKKVLSVVIFAILVGSFSIVYADDLSKQISVYFNKINVTVDGEAMYEDNILYNGTTYIPLRSVSKMLDKDVNYDPKTNTASITSDQKNLNNSYHKIDSGSQLSKNITSFKTPLNNYDNIATYLQKNDTGEFTEFYIPFYLLKDVAIVKEDSSSTLSDQVYNIIPKENFEEVAVKYVTPYGTYNAYSTLAGTGIDGKDHLYIPSDVLSGLITFTNIGTNDQRILRISTTTATSSTSTSSSKTNNYTPVKPDKTVYEILTTSDNSSVLKIVLSQTTLPSIINTDSKIQEKWLAKYKTALANTNPTSGTYSSWEYSIAIRSANNYVQKN